MDFAYNYFNSTKPEMEGDANFSSLTYENVISKEELWNSEETIWVMGTKFNLPQQKENFLSFIKSKLWFTYRRGFGAIGGTGPTSDAGWGCMLRCGQMMFAEALSILALNKDTEGESVEEKKSLTYKKILKQFSDDRSSCYSIHQIAQMGVAEGKEVGQWFGPNTVSQVLKKLSQFDHDNVFIIHVAMDNTLCTKDIEKLCYSLPEETTSSLPVSTTTASSGADVKPEQFWKPLFLIIPLRLGLSEINPVYFDQLKEVLRWEESVGVIGGRPNHAYYFLGCSDDSLVFLDPHTTQPFVVFPNLESNEELPDETYHCECPSRMQLSQLDPSLALGFACSTKSQFDNICDRVKSFKKTKTSLPLFEVLESFPQYDVKESRILTIKSHSRERRKNLAAGTEQQLDENTCLALDSDESLESDDEFEVLEFH